MNISPLQNDVQYGSSLPLQHGPDFSQSKIPPPSTTCAMPTQGETNAWLEKAQKMLIGCRALEPEAARRLEALIALLKNEEATIAFGGHFKSGKSTLINALLGRPILPTSGLPETGAMCIMRAGAQDTAHLSDATGRRELECTTEAIRQEISLTASSGARRTQTHDIERLELELVETSIGSRARWIDSPGINDTEEMTECARRAAAEADILLWVLSTRQLLSIAEVDFLSDRVARFGPESIALIVNAFLMDEDDARWEEFLHEQMPVHAEKIRERALDIGLDPDERQLVTVVSGKVLGLQWGERDERFGGKAIADLMDSFSFAEKPFVQRARWSRIVSELFVLEAPFAEHLKADLQTQQEVKKQSREAQKTAIEAARTNRAAFESAVAEAVDAFQLDWEIKAYNCGETLANSIVPPHIWRDDTYTKYLNGALEAANAEGRATLKAKLISLAEQHTQTLPNAACISTLAQMLTAPAVLVVVPDTPAPTNMNNFMDSMGLRGQEAAFFAKAKANAEATHWNVRHVTQYAATFQRSHRDQVVVTILEHCVGLGDRLTRALPLESFSGGEVAPISTPLDVGAADEPGTAVAYPQERNGVFACRAANLPPNSSCLVRLHFAETKHTKAGERRFHVSTGGKRVLSEYDIFARAGANKILVAEFAARSDASGNLALHFEAGSVGQPQVCAVQVIPQAEVTSRLSQIKMRAQGRHELWRDLMSLKEDAEKLMERFSPASTPLPL